MEQNAVLDKMHKLHLILADELKRICDENDIKFFLLAGSMLGAVRHKGFIPWDDDMDFGMLRKDFEKFIHVCKQSLDTDKFYLQTDRSEENYAFNFAKLRLCGTKVIESFSSSVAVNQGIYIDIFPLDYVYESKWKRRVQYRRFWFYRNLLLVKCGYGSETRKKKPSYRTAKLLSHFFTIKALKKWKHQAITSCSESSYIVTSDGSYGLNKETLKTEWVMELSEYPFEDRKYLGIKDYDAYLTYFYGDYMQPPPPNSRNHHAQLEVDFGKYQ